MEKSYAEKLIKEYSQKQKEQSKLDELKALDRKAKTPAKVFTYVFGVLGALILGLGMCLAMKVIGGNTPLMILGIVIGVIGIVMVSINYAIYTKILNKLKQKYSEEIIQKSNELLNNNK